MSGRPPQPEKAGEMLALARAFLERRGIEEARLEAELLVAHSLGLNRLGLFMQLDRPLSAREIDAARDLLVRRGKREPVAYIIGKREFYGRDFEVGRGVLIPRPETELLVDIARDWAKARQGAAELEGADSGAAQSCVADLPAADLPVTDLRTTDLRTTDLRTTDLRVGDLGAGSGCLAVTLALELEAAFVLAVDISAEALAFTERNAEKLAARVETCVGDGLPTLLARAPFDLVVSNPPYVLRASAASLEPEVRDFEPELALYAPDDDPDSFARALIGAANELLAPGGLLLIELGFDQGARALDLAKRAGHSARLHEDLARVPRVLEVRRES